MTTLHQISYAVDGERVTLLKKNASLEYVFEEIKKQTGYKFLYTDEMMKETKPLDVNFENYTLHEALKQSFVNQPLFYTINYKTVIIKRKPLTIKKDVPPLTITGKITDNTGGALPGVSVKLKGASIGATTDIYGNYTLNALENNPVLVFTYIGFVTQEVVVNGRAVIDVVLAADVQKLDEVVVVGYGTQKKETLTGSVTTVKGSEIIKSPVTNVSNSLSGRLAGVTVVTRGGEPGNDGSTIRIRGSNTLGNNGALVVVDGIPGRSLDRIDPNSIESITVLKDASAAIYGSQAANGVILITTKRGKISKPKVVVNLNSGFNQPTRIPKMTNAAQYATALNELDFYAGYQPRYTTEDIQKYSDGSDPWGHPNTNWFDAVLKSWSNQTQGNINISGGGEFMRYFISLGAKTQDANYKNSATKYKQYDFRTNLDVDVTKDKNITFGFDVVGRLENSNFPGRGGSGGAILGALQRGKPTMPAYWPNGLPGPDVERGENPVALATNLTGFTDNKYYVLNTNFKLNINVPWIKGLSLTGNASIDKGIRFNKNFQQPWYLYAWDGISYDANNIPVLVKGMKGIADPNLNEYMEDNYDYLLNGLINYKKTILTDHNISFLAGIETRTGGSNNFSAYRRYFVSTALPQLNAGGSNALNNSGTAYSNARFNYFGRVNYNFKEKYLAEFVWRVDGSYIFPEAGRFGFFPGISVGWRLSEENFWKNNLGSISDNIKLRASYGETGNDRIDPWQYLSTYGFNSTNYIFDISNEARTLSETRIPNPNVTWEVAKQMNVGIDAGFFKNKLSITVDYFDYKRSNILWVRNASVPTSTGLTLPRENIGRVSNKGFDFDVAYNNPIGDFKYTIGVNGGYAKNEITFWDESPGAPVYQQSTGHPIPSNPNNPDNDLYYQALGIFRDQAALDKYPHWPKARPGDVIFEDVNGDGKINAQDRVRNDKNEVPTLTGGLNLGLQYKQFDLSVLFQGNAGAVRYLRFEASGNFGNYLLSDYEDRWTPQNIDGTKPRIFDRIDQYYRSERSTYLLQKTDFIRLKNVELGYNLSANLLKSLNIQNFRVFASGFNLLTYSPGLKDLDPEDNNQGGINYPLQRIVNFGVSITL
ncbi:TonB-dependent receptor [Pedobacter sp. CG_S7]|uniref:SusC/RagA family TonB-linked outer membrane protein n=1 Tax=Pedobacter sp. CG_S7 TaxID=3143930 RepID=UPI0033932713